MIKKLIRLVLKVPATPIVVLVLLLLISIGYGFKVYEWLYDASDLDKKITRSLISDHKGSLKRWFTTI